jgi:hypothetical protein
VIVLKNTFEEKMHHIKIERELLLSLLQSADITHIEGKSVETLKNVEMKQLIINNLKQYETVQNEPKSKTNYRKLKLVSAL